jgi:lysylphosphatidylglycerol synthetase-like protein (DUF2156 family)
LNEVVAPLARGFAAVSWVVSPLMARAAALLQSGTVAEVDARRTATAGAVVLWLLLAIVAVVCLGAGLILGVVRGARRVRRKHEPVHTEMQDIWFLNPPENRKPNGP